jgi:two-component system invasion response regulator UvrY
LTDVFIVDDHAVMRDGLRALLEQAGHRVVGEAEDPARAVQELVRLKPAVVLLDLQLGERSGLEVLQQIAARKLPTRAVVLTMFAQRGQVAEALRAGAAGYVLKGSPSAEVLAAVQAVAQGQTHLGPQVSALAVAALTRDEGAAINTLSTRERQVLSLVVRGHSSAAIAEQIHLSPKTVESYRSRLMAKLGVADLPALVRLAIREGVISADE